MTGEIGDYLPCVSCGKLGYTDQRTQTAQGYICVRCARPDIDWKKIDTASPKV